MYEGDKKRFLLKAVNKKRWKWINKNNYWYKKMW